jgi:PPOX class probable F420-dependent enzyme
VSSEPDAPGRLAGARVARLATVRPDGSPHIVPITFAMDGERLVFAVDRKPKSSTRLRRVANIESDPRVSVLVDDYDDRWERLWWVRADGRAHVADERESGSALAALASKYEPYRREPPPGPVVVVEIERWSAWTAS